MSHKVQLQYCQVKQNEHLPLAIVRFTAYDEDNKPLAVEQVTYEHNTEYLETEVTAALQAGVDVSIFTSEPMTSFPLLERIASYKSD